MFTGIIEATGIIQQINAFGSNKTFKISSPLASSLKIDQSLSHNGVCLTVEAVWTESYQVTAIAETLSKTTLQGWKENDRVNLERCMVVNARLDGHIVQGHVDTVGECISKKELNGSWEFGFRFPERFAPLIIEKGSISLNGISLTVFNVRQNEFTVAIIPYTYTHTSIQYVDPGSAVNLEFDMIGKYVQRSIEVHREPSF